jgi:RAS protein activator-like 2
LFQYKRDDGIYDNHLNQPGNNNGQQLAFFNNRYERRLSVESARTLSDSSTDTENKIHHKESKRRKNKADKSIEQCEREIFRLQSSVDLLRRKLEESEIKGTSDSIDSVSHQSDNKIRSIISRCVKLTLRNVY